jgi:hypothetical protein
MNVAMRLTLDGLLRALRWRAHSAADEIAATRAERPKPGPAAARKGAARPRSSRETPDGQPRR